MSLLDNIAKKFLTDTNNDGKVDAQDVAAAFKNLVSENSDALDFNGLVEKFKNANLSDTVASWLSNGENKPISSQQIEQVFDTEKLAAFASSLKIELAEAKEMLAKAIPNLVDKFSSDGKLLNLQSLDTTSILDRIKKLF